MLAYNFYNDWLDVTNMYKANGIDHVVTLPENFFNNLKFDSDSLRNYRINAAIKCAETLGNKPALLLSGGVDSQSMIQCFQEANLNYDIISFTFDKDLNVQDSNYAKFFCKMKNIKCIELKFDVINFLQTENFSIGTKYKSASPQFNVHYKMGEILRDMGYTGICCGGFAPALINNEWGTNFDYNTCHYTNIQEILSIPFQGNFLSYTPELSWTIGLLTEGISMDNLKDSSFHKYNKEMAKRYDKKIEGYIRHGFEIYPQPQKFTGFELIKDYFASKTSDGWFFEKTFRMPLLHKFKKVDQKTYQINLSEKQKKELLNINLINIASKNTTTAGIS